LAAPPYRNATPRDLTDGVAVTLLDPNRLLLIWTPAEVACPWPVTLLAPGRAVVCVTRVAGCPVTVDPDARLVVHCDATRPVAVTVEAATPFLRPVDVMIARVLVVADAPRAPFTPVEAAVACPLAAETPLTVLLPAEPMRAAALTVAVAVVLLRPALVVPARPVIVDEPVNAGVEDAVPSDVMCPGAVVVLAPVVAFVPLLTTCPAAVLALAPEAALRPVDAIASRPVTVLAPAPALRPVDPTVEVADDVAEPASAFFTPLLVQPARPVT
jgi:hypothetical protein